MDAGSAETFVASLGDEQKLLLVAQLCHHITIVSRDTYDAGGGVVDAERLRKLNEIQHLTSAALVSLADAKASRGLPDKSLISMFVARRDDAELSRLLSFAFERSVEAFQRQAAEELN